MRKTRNSANTKNKGKKSSAVPKRAESPGRQPLEMEEHGEGDNLAGVGEMNTAGRVKWTIEKERELCKLWRREDHLYDSTSRNYRNTHMRGEAYARIGAVLGVDAEDVGLHLRSLRTAFTKLSNVPSGSAANRLTARQREILDMCSFLRCHIKTREGVSNLPRPANDGNYPSPVKNYPTPRPGLRTKAAAEAARRNGPPEPMETEEYVADNLDLGNYSITSAESSPVARPRKAPRNPRPATNEPQPSTSGGGGARPKVPTRQRNNVPARQAREENLREEGAVGGAPLPHDNGTPQVEEPAYYVRSRKRKTQNDRNGEVAEAMAGRANALDRLSTSIGNLANTAANEMRHERQERQQEGPIDFWVRILAARLKEMEKKKARRCMLEMDHMIIQTLERDEENER